MLIRPPILLLRESDAVPNEHLGTRVGTRAMGGEHASDLERRPPKAEARKALHRQRLDAAAENGDVDGVEDHS